MTLQELLSRGSYANLGEVAGALGVSYDLVRRMAARYDERVLRTEARGDCSDEVYEPRAGEIPCMRVGSRYRVILRRMPQLRRPAA